MSFSMEAKEELIDGVPEADCCRRAFLYGMLLFGRSFSRQSVSLQTENRRIASVYRDFCTQLCGVRPQCRQTRAGKFSLHIDKRREINALMECFGHAAADISLRINRSNFNCDACENAFLAGAFLSCGTISSPEKDYHLEFVVPYMNLSKSMVKLMSEMDLEPKTAKRSGYTIIYFKESESIEACLYRMGAHKAAFDIMNIKVVKDFRNKANRMANCETANINRIVGASAQQIQAIERIYGQKGAHYLSEELQEIAALRLANPEASLQELAELTADGLSRSGVNHRLKKIEKIAEEL